jgi:hypothetical protein
MSRGVNSIEMKCCETQKRADRAPRGQSAGVTTAPNAIIDGTGMSRPGSGIGMIGGPAKNVEGVMNGTGIQPKQL